MRLNIEVYNANGEQIRTYSSLSEGSAKKVIEHENKKNTIAISLCKRKGMRIPGSILL